MTQTILALALFLFPLAYSPGPGNLFFAAIGARAGVSAAGPALIGYHLATWIVTIALGLGLAAFAGQAGGAFQVLKWIGAVYVLWLALRFLTTGALEAGEEPRPARAMDGAVLLLLNPKAYVIIALMFTQFLPVGEQATLGPVLVIATIFTLNNLLAFLVWTTLGDRLARRFRAKAQARWMNMGFGLLLAGVAVWMAVG